jgi:hypothetical protein
MLLSLASSLFISINFVNALENNNIIFSVNHIPIIRKNGVVPFYIDILNNGTQSIEISKIYISVDSEIINETDINKTLGTFDAKSYSTQNCNSEIKEPEGLFSITLYLDFQKIFNNEEFKPGKTILFNTNFSYIQNKTEYFKLINTSLTIEDELPYIGKSPGWYYGDLHVHTEYTDCDCPIPIVLCFNGQGSISDRKIEALNLGLNWLSITDHSYCLNSDDWNNLRSNASSATDSSFVILPGEELSVSEDCSKNSPDEIACGSYCLGGDAGHMGAIGLQNFIENTPNWCNSYRCPDYPGAQQGIDLVNLQNGISIINHPFNQFVIELLSAWDYESFSCVSGEDGIEIWNGGFDNFDIEALNFWRDRLLNGTKIYAYSGSDSENGALFGNGKFVYIGCYLENLSDNDLKYSLKNGHCFISNNGFLSFEIKGTSDTNWKKLGSELNVYSGEEITISINYNVFDKCRLQLKKGYIDSNEFTKADYGNITGPGTFTFYDSYTYDDGYYRLECVNETTNKRIYTNPIWFNVNEITTTSSTTTSTSSTTSTTITSTTTSSSTTSTTSTTTSTSTSTSSTTMTSTTTSTTTTTICPMKCKICMEANVIFVYPRVQQPKLQQLNPQLQQQNQLQPQQSGRKN